VNYCRECGKFIENDQQQCPYCGTEVNDTIDIENQNAEINTDIYAEIKSVDEEEPVFQRESFDEAPYEASYETPYLRENKYNTVHNPVEFNTPPLSNWIKVTLSVLIPALPGLGALIGVIAAIIFMTKEDEDRKTFGYALLTYSVIFLVLLCSCCMIFFIGASDSIQF